MARSTLIIALLLLCVVVAAPRSSSAGASYLKFFSFEVNGSVWCLRGFCQLLCILGLSGFGIEMDGFVGIWETYKSISGI